MTPNRWNALSSGDRCGKRRYPYSPSLGRAADASTSDHCGRTLATTFSSSSLMATGIRLCPRHERKEYRNKNPPHQGCKEQGR